MQKIMQILKNNRWVRMAVYLNTFLFMIYGSARIRLVDNSSSNITTITNPEIVSIAATSSSSIDNLSSVAWWQYRVNNQIKINENKELNACLFGDSISSHLDNTLGNNNFNFALPAMTTISLIQQLKMLDLANVKCKQAIIAIGTNDADSAMTDNDFFINMRNIITRMRLMGATKIILIPAFYSTLEASHKPELAAPISRVEEINNLISLVGKVEKVLVVEETIKPLFDGQKLKSNLTIDGVHLNEDGLKIYRESILKIITGS